MIGEKASTVRRPTRAEQRVITQRALVDAAAACLVDAGYAGLTTRAVAARAGVAQSTLMHHFPTREALLTSTVTGMAMRLADDALEEIDLAALRRPDQREAVLDQAWRQFTSPFALGAAQLWVAAWNEPELAVTLSEVEKRLGGIILATAAALFPVEASTPRFVALIDTVVSLMCGLITAIPISGQQAVDARWSAMKPILLDAATLVLGQ
ncbi:TetR/AcrR family transcriptional regulator [Paraconexibacter antarcticus]|uniref:TetR/AcrR family transcriptional regulator n=1 Tax=Paraconexibacter antarcticus TaxID=2949664 RepID=A0ABY5DZQ3_9ACTN|nr:TetR/AcrR family transcriptional regulator [Paraconexibacter antarcticus]UTI66706.1 TetR/AcrR family transcriptional regulator [Paraconexibacter antarcticus]